MYMITYARVQTEVERDVARKLIARVYARQGYTDEGSEASGFDQHLEDAATCTIIARIHDEIVGTISVVPDGREGVPMDIIYSEELSRFRDAGARLAEVCQFAVDHDLLRSAIEGSAVSELDLSMGLFGHAVHYARFSALSHFVFAVNPKHRTLYESLGSELIGEEKEYPSVNRAPALGYALGIGDMSPTNFFAKKIFQTSISPDFFEAYAVSSRSNQPV